MSTNIRGHAFTDIEITALVTTSSGVVELEIASFNMKFQINEIPVAQFKVALGTKPGEEGNASVAKAHTEAEKLERRNPVTILASLVGTSYRNPETRESKQWNGTKAIFHGYINRPAYTEAGGGVGLSFEAVHWLSDLAITSKMSPIFHPSSASDIFKYATSSETMGPNGGPIIRPADAQKDIWGKGIKAVLLSMTEKDLIAGDHFGSGHTPVPNTYPLEALNRMDNPEHVNVMPLTLKPELIEETSCMDYFSSTGLVNNTMWMDNGMDTVWSTMVTLAKDYQYDVIPTVESATVAPVIPVARDVFKTIEANEYEAITTSGSSESGQLPLYGIKLYGGQAMETISNDETQELFTSTGVVGTYPSKDEIQAALQAGTAGQLLHLPAPRIIPSFIATKQPKPYNKKDAIPPGNFNSIGDGLAHAMYTNQVFAGRGCSISGRIRFDIAPGSLIELEIVGKNVPQYNTSDGQGYLYAKVHSVRYSFSAEEGKAYTAINFSNLYTYEERRVEGLVVDSHPMYNKVWQGTELIKDFEKNG